jgi:hypothetical protein
LHALQDVAPGVAGQLRQGRQVGGKSSRGRAMVASGFGAGEPYTSNASAACLAGVVTRAADGINSLFVVDFFRIACSP